MSNKQWYYADDSETQQGPVSAAELKRLALAGRLKPEHEVWREGMDNWAAAGTIKGLLPGPASQAAGPRVAKPAAVEKQAGDASQAAVKSTPKPVKSPKPVANSKPASQPFDVEVGPAADRGSGGAATSDPFNFANLEGAEADEELEEDEIEDEVFDDEVLDDEVLDDEEDDVYEDEVEEEYEYDIPSTRHATVAHRKRGAPAKYAVTPAPASYQAKPGPSTFSVLVWSLCVVGVIAGVVLFAMKWSRADDYQSQTSAALLWLGVTFATYVTAHALDRIGQSLK